MRTTPTSTLRGVLSIMALFFSFALALGLGIAQASGTLTNSAPLAQVPGDLPTIPVAAPSGVVAVPTGPPSAAVPGTGGTDTSASGGFPWLILIILRVVGALADTFGLGAVVGGTTG